MAETTHPKTYLDKVFDEPSYIWHDGTCDIGAVEESVSHLAARFADVVPEQLVALDNAVESNQVSDDQGRHDVTPSKSVVVPLRSDVWNGREPLNYHAQITIGQDPKPFFVDLDTGSSILWVQSQLGSRDSPIVDQTSYIPSDSRTSQSLDAKHTISYGDGSHISASLFADDVTIGDLTASKHVLAAAASHDIKDAFLSKSSNGILGLGFPLLTAGTTDGDSMPNLILSLYRTGRLKYASMSIVGPRNDPKLAAEIDETRTLQPRGSLIVGSVDPSFYTGSISWCPQLVPDRWIVALDAVTINGTTILERQKALIDTGTPYVVASPSNFKKVINCINGARPWKEEKNLYFTYPKSCLEKVSFTFGGRVFNMFPQDFSLGGQQMYDRAVTSAEGTPAGKGILRVVSSIVRLASWPFEQDLWVIGGIFLDNIVTIFDFAEHKIGFADINEDDL